MKKLTRIALVVLLIGALVTLYAFRFSPSARRQANFKQGELYFQGSRYDEAKVAYLSVIRSDGSNRLAIERMGAIWLAQGSPVEAMRYLLRLKELEKENVGNRMNIARAFLALGDFVSAGKEAVFVFEKDPRDDAAWVCLADTAIGKEDVDRIEKGLRGVTSLTGGQEYASAVLDLKQGDLESAEQKFTKAAGADPLLARAHIRLADVRLLRSDPVGAAKALEKAYSVAPARSLDRLRYPEFQAQQGKTAEARGLVEAILREAPDYIPASIMLGVIAIREKNYPEALKALESVARRDANNHQARLLQGQIQMAQGNTAAAIGTFELLAKTYPTAGGVQLELGRAYAVAGRFSEASTALRQSLSLSPRPVEATLLLAEIELRSSRPQAAMDALKEILARSPNFPAAQKLQAMALRALKRFDEATAIYRKQTETMPANPDGWKLLGAVLLEQRKVEEARAAFERALKLEPQQIGTVNSLVELDLMGRNFDAALARLAGLDDKTRNSAEARIVEARIRIAQKNWPLAEKALLEATALKPDLDVAFQLLVTLYFQNGRFDEAIARVEEKLAKTPEDMGSVLLAARLYEQKKDFSKAREAYERILAKQGDAFIVLNNLACLLSEHFSERARAEELARKARELSPGNPLVADSLGWILYRRGDYDGALSLLKESATRMAERANAPAEVIYHFGMASAAVGMFEDAVASLTKAAGAPEDFPGKAGIAERLSLLKPVTEGGVSLERLQVLIRETPGDPLAHLRMGEYLESQKKDAAAVAAYEQALKANPKLAIAAVALARVQTRTNPAEAIDSAKRARNMAPSDPTVAAQLGLIAARAGDLNWAYSLLREGKIETNADPASLLEFAKVAYRLGKTDEARSTLERASAASAENAGADIRAYRRMIDLSIQSTVSEAEAGEIAEVLKNDQAHLPARMARANAASRKKNPGEAIRIYEGILETNPGFPNAQALLAAALVEAGGNWEKAHELAEACRRQVPADPTAALVLGETFYRRKEFSRTVDLLTEASRATPLDSKRLFFLGGAYFELNNKSRSEEVLRQAIAAGLQSPEREQAEEILKKIKG